MVPKIFAAVVVLIIGYFVGQKDIYGENLQII
ncbi:hypothetical protein [Okeania sp. SIO2C9]